MPVSSSTEPPERASLSWKFITPRDRVRAVLGRRAVAQDLDLAERDRRVVCGRGAKSYAKGIHVERGLVPGV